MKKISIEDFKLKKAVPLVQIQCPNCKGYKTMKDSKKSQSLTTGGTLFFLGVIFNLFMMWFIGLPLLLAGIITLFVAQNTMKDDGSMECRNCKLKFKTETESRETVTTDQKQ